MKQVIAIVSENLTEEDYPILEKLLSVREISCLEDLLESLDPPLSYLGPGKWINTIEKFKRHQESPADKS